MGHPGLDKIKDAAEAVGLRPICRYCTHYLGDFCERTCATQIPDGICLDWEASPEPPPLLSIEMVPIRQHRSKPRPVSFKQPAMPPIKPMTRKPGLPMDQVKVKKLRFIMPAWGQWRDQMHIPYHGKRKGRMK